MSRFISDLTTSEAFLLALAVGAAGLVLGAIVAGLWRRSNQPPIGGVFFSAGAVFVLATQFELPLGVPLGAAAMFGGAMLGREAWQRMGACLPGAVAIVYSSEAATGAGSVVLTVAIAAAAGLVTDFDRFYRSTALGLPLLAISTLGVLITVPDTERAMVLFGVALPLALLGWPLRLISMGPGAAAAVGLIGWVAALAGDARAGAAVGAVASLGLMLAEPLGRMIAGTTRTALHRIAAGGPFRALIVIALHGAMVLVASRLAGLQQGGLAALIIVVPVLAVGAFIGAAPAAAPSSGDNSSSDLADRS